MLDLAKYNSLGEALSAAVDRWPDEICLIEADRDRENARFTYSQFSAAAMALGRALQDAGFKSGTRAAIIMTNQSKWLISAYAIFFCGGVLVPLDYKLSAAEQLTLLAHSKAEFLVVEYHLWQAIARADAFPDFRRSRRARYRSAERRRAPRRETLGGVSRDKRDSRARIRSARAKRSGVHRLFVGHGRPAERLRAHARELSRAVRRAHFALPFLAGRSISQHSAYKSCD